MDIDIVEMDFNEASRRFEAILVQSNYSMSGIWTSKLHLDESQEVFSMSISNIPNLRAVMWKQGVDYWEGMISFPVGEEGEFPLGGIVIKRGNHKLTIPDSSKVSKKTSYLIELFKLWNSTSPASDELYITLINLALSFIRKNDITKARSILVASLRGDLTAATIAESLSIAQHLWCKTMDEKVRSSLVWKKIFWR